MADLNLRDLNHWFKSQFKSTVFFGQKVNEGQLDDPLCVVFKSVETLHLRTP